MPTYVTAMQLAEILQVPIPQVHRLASRGRIPRIKLGHRTVRFDLEKVRVALAVEPGTDKEAAENDLSAQVDELLEDIDLDDIQ